MKEIKLTDLTLEDLLPHRGHMLLVEEVVEGDRHHAVTLCRAKKSWPLAEKDGVHPLILVELAAQTAGISNGLDRIKSRGIDSEKTGWLVGIKKANFSIEIIPFGSIIRSKAENRHNFSNLREVVCEQSINGEVVSSITLQLYQDSET